MRYVVDAEHRFAVGFDADTGLYVRSTVRDAQGGDTGREAFMASFPHLLDVGIMGHCRHGVTGRCLEAGIQCYQDGLNRQQSNMSLSDFTRIVQECAGRVFQFALGGRGDPDEHEHFEEILALSREAGIVPNFTTSGWGLTPERAGIAARYCGAVAVSWQRGPHTLRAVEHLLTAGVKTNLHFVLGNNTIDEAYSRLVNHTFPKGINRVVFLLHKPVGLGQSENVLHMDDPRVRRFFELFNEAQYCDRAGFDSCTVPALIHFAPAIDTRTIEACEGGRFSAYITPDLHLLPCSFDQSGRWAVDVSTQTLEEAWTGSTLADFRSSFRKACPSCTQREDCLGGCPIVPEIVLCALDTRR